MVPEEFSRTALLIGEQGVQRLRTARVAVFGIGGVGSFTVEALARAGIGSLLLVDDDVVTPSNINRQLPATTRTVGKPKTALMADRVQKINPAATVEALNAFCLPDNVSELLAGPFDYIVDAVDTVSAKLALAEEAFRRGIPIVSAMGAGNKMDPTRFRVADIGETSVCPLCRVMRRELKKRGIPRLKVVFSTEPPIAPQEDLPEAPGDAAGAHRPKRQAPGSISFVPSVAGLILAGEVVRDLIRWPDDR